MSRKVIKKSNRYAGVYQYQKGKEKLWGYRLKYYDHTGKRKEKTGSGFADDREAYQHMIDVENNINKGNMHIVNPSKITFGEMLDVIMDENKPNEKGIGYWSNATYHTYKVFKEYYVKGTISHIKLSDLTAELYRKEFINKMTDMHPNSLELYHRKANAVINEAVEREYIVKNKIKHVKLPKDVSEKEEKFLTTEELQLLLNRLDEIPFKKYMFKVMFYLLIYSGMRIGELRALRWNDIDYDLCQIRINKQMDPVNRIGLTKSRISRTIEIEKMVIDMLKVLKKKRINEERFNGDDDYIFKSYQLETPVSYINIRYNLIRISNDVLDREISPHIFRHTHASILLMSGQPSKVVAHRLGNTNQTLNKHYSHIIDGITSSPVDVFSSNIGAKSGASDKIIKI